MISEQLASFREAFAAAGSTAVHLETRARYAIDGPELEAWRAGRLPTLADRAAWWTTWHQLVADTVSRGVGVRRVRLVDDPPMSDHMAYAHAVTPRNLAAGEQVRWLARRDAPLLVPPVDFWLLDDVRLFEIHFDGRDHLMSIHEVDVPELAELYGEAFATLWRLATPHEHYQPPGRPG